MLRCQQGEDGTAEIGVGEIGSGVRRCPGRLCGMFPCSLPEQTAGENAYAEEQTEKQAAGDSLPGSFLAGFFHGV